MSSPNIQIDGVPIFADNYIWLILNRQQKKAIAIDPGDAKPLQDYLCAKQLKLEAILITHHHADHVGGILPLIQNRPIPVYGPHNPTIRGLSHPIQEPDQFSLPFLPNPITVFNIPGHTLDHIAYYLPGMLFSGDTLFSAGCGRVFEGTMAQMFHSLQKIAALPNDTKIYCTHEYTLNNLQFAQKVEPDNLDIQHKITEVKKLRTENKPSVPTQLGDEKKINPFLRCHVPAVMSSVERQTGLTLRDPIIVFQYLREWKNQAG